MVFHWSLTDSKSLQVSWTLFSILAYLNNSVVWIDSTSPLISKSSCLFITSLVTLPSGPVTIGITVIFMFHSFFSSLARSRCLSFFSLSISFTLKSAETAKSTVRQVLFFFSWLSRGLVVWPRLGVPFVSQNPREFTASHFLGRILDCASIINSYEQI